MRMLCKFRDFEEALGGARGRDFYTYVSYNVASLKTVFKIVICCPNIYYTLMGCSLLDTGKKKMNLICPEPKSLQFAGEESG